MPSSLRLDTSWVFLDGKLQADYLGYILSTGLSLFVALVVVLVFYIKRRAKLTNRKLVKLLTNEPARKGSPLVWAVGLLVLWDIISYSLLVLSPWGLLPSVIDFFLTTIFAVIVVFHLISFARGTLKLTAIVPNKEVKRLAERYMKKEDKSRGVEFMQSLIDDARHYITKPDDYKQVKYHIELLRGFMVEFRKHFTLPAAHSDPEVSLSNLRRALSRSLSGLRQSLVANIRHYIAKTEGHKQVKLHMELKSFINQAPQYFVLPSIRSDPEVSLSDLRRSIKGLMQSLVENIRSYTTKAEYHKQVELHMKLLKSFMIQIPEYFFRTFHIQIQETYSASQAIQLRDYQKDAVRWFSKVRRGILGDQMGLGKTITSIAAMEHIGAFPFLVVCPKTLVPQWIEECGRMDVNAAELSSKGVKKHSKVRADAYVVSYSQISRFKMNPQNLRGLIVDEFHLIKNRSAKRSQAVRAMSKVVPNVLLMSGTPITNSPKDLLHPLECLNKLNSLFGGRKDYIKQYCNPKITGTDYTQHGASNTMGLHSKLSSTIYLRREKEEVLKELPEKMRTLIKVELTKYRNMYIRFKKRTDIDSGKNEMRGVISKLRDLCCKEKMPFVKQWIKDHSSERIIIFGHHKKYLTALSAADSDSALVTGDVSTTERRKIFSGFKEKSFRRLYLNIEVGGVGLNLATSSNVLFYELPWTHAALEQCEDRIHRLGQKNTCNYYFILVGKAIDEYMWKVCNRKKQISDEVVSGRRATPVNFQTIMRNYLTSDYYNLEEQEV